MTRVASRRRPGNDRSGARRFASMAAVLAMVGAAVLLTSPSAAAAPVAPLAAPAPTDPETADQAKQAWIDAARRSEQFGERVLDAKAAVASTAAKAKTAAAAARTAASAVAAADRVLAAAARAVDAATTKVRAADTAVAGYQRQIDAFADASFRGASTSSLTALFTADSPEDFLDGAAALDSVADDNRAMLQQATSARAAAAAARAAAERARAHAAELRARAEKARAAAAAVQAAADKAHKAAVAAQKQLAVDRVNLDKEITSYQTAYARLSAADLGEAVDSVEQANLSDAAMARHAAQRAQRAAAGITEDPAIPTGIDLSVLAAKQAPSVAAGIAVEAALSRRGLPYVWDGTGPDVFDCSGLMLWSWQQAGVQIPRSSAAQAAGLRTIPLEELKPGDLVTYYSPTSHVAMYIGNGLVIHASMPGVPIKVVSLHRAGPDPVGHAVNR